MLLDIRQIYLKATNQVNGLPKSIEVISMVSLYHLVVESSRDF